MAQFTTTNYSASGFTWATAGNDQFRITDLQNLAQGVEAHDHTATFGLAVMRIGTGCAVGTTVINGTGTLTLPTTTDTIIGRATTDTLTNKTLTTPVIKAATGAPAVRVYSSILQSPAIPNNTHTALIFDTARYDTDPLVQWVVGSPSRLTAKTAGYYAMSGVFGFAANVTGDRQIEIKLNGTTYIATSTHPAPAQGCITSVSTQWYMNVNDYVELIVFQTSGAGLAQFSAGSATYCEFMMARVTG